MQDAENDRQSILLSEILLVEALILRTMENTTEPINLDASSANSKGTISLSLKGWDPLKNNLWELLICLLETTFHISSRNDLSGPSSLLNLILVNATVAIM
mmetsp:Transcript_7605/g.11169  ORF Transcript_7605/g.11169 Transcript_7605/m.11169 type:complete len:101 (-) Transcript_7605:65-367(-)